MATNNIREAMASQDKPSVEIQEEQTTTVAPVEKQEPTSEPTKPSEEEAQDAEPDEDSFEDRAEFKKALKEWTKKQTERELREQHKKEVDGYYADLRKQRQQKRELKVQLETLQKQQAQAMPTSIPKPDINLYSDPEQYANDMVNYDRATRQLEAQKTQAEQQYQRSQSETIDTIWAHNVEQSGVTDIAQVVAHVEKTGLLNDFGADVRQAIVLSPAGPHVLKFLAMNPDVAEEIADSAKPLAELKTLETMLIKSIYNKAPAQQNVAPSAPIVNPKVETPPKFVPPTTPKSGSSHTGAPAKLTDAKTMEDFMRKRMSMKQNKKW